MELHLFRLLFDLGLFILILMVQLIIYPGFRYYSKNDLLNWHRYYTKKITLIVIPLMLGQLIIAIIFLLNRTSFYDIVVSLLVSAVWVITLLFFLPAHRKISEGTHSEELIIKMVHTNWWRTAIWSTLFLLNFLDVSSF